MRPALFPSPPLHAVTAPSADARARVRREVRAERRALGSEERRRRSHRLCTRLARSGALLRARRVAGFWPNDGEVDLTALFARLWSTGARVYLPVIAGPRLWFAPFRPDTAFADNRFGIPEPRVARGEACPLLALDLVLMPLVAFDHEGNRIGMGGGYYDRTFAWRRHRQALRGPRLLGTGFGFQCRDALPPAPWDVPLDGAVTDEGVYRFRRG